MMDDPREINWKRILNRNTWIIPSAYVISNILRDMELTNEANNMDLFY
jgi:hypothetical protein